MADKKILTNEQLADDKLDNIAGGAVYETHIVRQAEQVKKVDRTVRTEYNPLSDEHDINLD